MSFTRGLLCPHQDHGISLGNLQGGSSSSTQKNTCTCGKTTTNLSAFTAAEWGDLDRIIRIVEIKGKDINMLDSGGYTMLHYAAQHNQVEVVRYLLNHGASPDMSGNGATALHRAAFSGSLVACELLLKAGADVHALDTSYGSPETPVRKAQKEGHGRVVEMLIQFGAKVDSDRTDHIAASSPTNTSSFNRDKPHDKEVFKIDNIERGTNNGAQTTKNNYNFGLECPICSEKQLVMVKAACCGTLICKNCFKKRYSRKCVCDST